MARSITKENVFATPLNKSEAKGDVTTRVAHSIIGTEIAAREAKTARLKAARLALEATQEPLAIAKKPVRQKPATRK